MADVADICRDLAAQRASLLTILADANFDLATPAPGWTIRDQATHLAFFDEAAHQSISDPDGFRAGLSSAATGGVTDFVGGVRDANAHRTRDDVLAWLTKVGADLVEAAIAADPNVRVPWYGPDMTVASCITARIMETWAHGQDIRDALGLAPDEANLSHVAFIGWRALANSFRARRLPVPDAPVRVELGEVVLGPADADNVVTGSLVDFCLVVTQRRHVADTDLVARGEVALAWLPIAQAFAGPPGAGREPNQFA